MAFPQQCSMVAQSSQWHAAAIQIDIAGCCVQPAEPPLCSPFGFMMFPMAQCAPFNKITANKVLSDLGLAEELVGRLFSWSFFFAMMW